MESIAARLRIDVLWALLRDNRTLARHPRRSLKRLDNPPMRFPLPGYCAVGDLGRRGAPVSG